MSIINVKTKELNPFKVQKKAKLIQELTDLENEVLEKLVELKKSKKAIAMVTNAESWQTIKEFIM
jgi:phenylpyruvate tautomerase PptA (4-oxalocrotonate tautomerase family)